MDGNKVQIRAGSRKNKKNICEATEEIIDEAKNDDNVTLTRHSTKVTFLKSMGSLPHRGEDNGYVDARFF